ncbi:HlyD family efflux transporter periplasmic adaptor subunit [Oscillatoriales cyanobacterium LEGE 11467]|uniref:HlyD family efflux transporter periplasmic adaptor subunit n=1 Tax=Zarconia navalis LEGE 11467 TaxID=1828826 RepID=A0A928W3H4_9CYAN|nr:HlyD family efflux transporter periplasmic adaptor subunit [Zarconia navalis]MBE9042525.1 HlyD family efflux transporter periplasmic adaptor subunit [Zarconia navalis LEGE 11467]
MTTTIQKIDTIQDQPVILEQPAIWTRAFIWLIVVMTASTLIWAALAKIDHSIPAQGKLEPDGALKEVKAPVGGVVREIHIEGGDKVKKGDLLVTLDPTTSEAEVEALRESQEILEQQERAISSPGSVGIGEGTANLDSLIQTRTALASENQFLQAQVNGGDPGGLVGGTFDANQQQLLDVSREELESRKRAANAEIRTLEEQISQARIQKEAAQERRPLEQLGLQSAEERVASARQRLIGGQERQEGARDRRRNAQERKRTAQEQLAKEQEILDRIRPVVEQGAVAELQLNRQEQQVLSSQNTVLGLESEVSSADDEINRIGAEMAQTREEIAALEGDIASRRAQITDLESEILRLQEEEQRLVASIDQAEARSKNSVDTTNRETLARIAQNQRQIAQIDDQLARTNLDNQRQIAQVGSELTRAEQTLAYRELRSPVDGIIFEIAPNAIGDVIGQGGSGTEPVVSIVPEGKLIAAGDVTNQDIGFLTEGMEVEVQIDAFPATEFGTIPGKLVSIGEDALPPDQNYQYWRFPVTVELGQQFIKIGQKDIPLQSGMSVRSNIKVRERTVLSIFLNKFANQKEVLENVR